MTFGVAGTDNWGAPEIVGNAIRDLAALNKVETLPWDEWGPMRACYENGLTPDIETLMDELTAAMAANDQPALAALHATLQVPDDMNS